MPTPNANSMDCKYCVALEKNNLPFYCRLKHHNVSEKSCCECDKRVYLQQMSIDNKNDW